VLLAVALSVWCEVHRPLAPANALVTFGRASLTAFVSHVWLFREASPRLGLWKALSPGATLLVIGLVVVAARLTRRWQRADYRYGAEWPLRMLAG